MTDDHGDYLHEVRRDKALNRISELEARVAELEAERNEPVTLSEWQKLKAENGRLREALGAIIHAWDSDDDWMGNDPAEIARAALEGREK